MATIAQLHLYLGMGRPMFPCNSKDKKPLTRNGFKDASLTPDAIVQWHSQYPDCAWGTPTSSEYGVIDIDPRNGGDATWDALIREHGPIPECPTVHTGGGGWHYVMRFPVGTRCGKIGVGIDRKVGGGYVIVPPSRVYEPHHYQPYKWVAKLWEVPIPDAPVWLLGLASPKPQRDETGAPAANPVQPGWEPGDIRTHPGSPEGGRRVTLCRLVGTALGCGHSPEAVRIWAEDWASRCEPPFGEWEKHFAGLVKREREKHFAGLVKREREKPNKTLHLSPVTDPGSPDTGRKELTGERGGVSSFLPGPQPPSPDGGVSSFLPEPGAVSGERGEKNGVVRQTPEPFALHPDAYHGLLGEVLRAVTPETEAHPAGVLLAIQTLFGNAVGNGAWVKVGPRRHHPALYTAIASRTSGGKGDAYAVARYLFGKADLEYCVSAIAQGVGSGEGLVERVRDELQTLGKRGEPVTLPGSPEKRCLLRLPELSRAFRVGRRESSTLSEVLREGWDGDPISIPNRGSNALVASGYSIGVLGDITPGALNKLLSTGTEAVDGYANRFLWCCVASQRDLPEGGNVAVLDTYAGRLKAVLVAAKGAGEVVRDADAKALWERVYPTLKTSGDSVPHTDRARPYVVRLSLIYALADGERVIRVPHLKAALAVWEWCRQSAESLFGGASVEASPEPDPLWVRILNVIATLPGVSRSELLRACREPADAVGDALTGLQVKGMAYPVRTQNPKGGPPAECWFSGREKPNNTGFLSPLPPHPSPNTDRPEPRKEGTNSPNPFAGLVVGDGNPPGTNPPEGTNSPPNPTGELVPSLNGPSAPSGRELVPSFPVPGAVSGEGRQVIQQWADTVNQFHADYEPRFEEHPSGMIQSRRMLPVSSGYPERVGELLRLPKPKPEPLSPVTTDYILRHSDLRWDGNKVIGVNLSVPEVEWVNANPQRARRIAERKSLT